MPYGKLGKLGVIHPATGTTVITELHRNLHEDITIYNVPAAFRKLSKEGLDSMDRDALEAARFFREFYPVDYLFFACTSGSFIGGAGYDQILCGRLREAAQVKRVSTTTTAVLEALRAVGAQNITMCTPYPDEVNLTEKAFLENEGFHLTAFAGLQKSDPRTVPTTELSEIHELVRKTWVPGSDTLFISCSGLAILPLIPVLEKELGVPVVTSNQAAIWNISRFFGAYNSRTDQLGKLFTL